MDTSLLVLLGVVVAAFVLVLIVLKSFWKVPNADEALVITGWGVGKADAEGGRTYKIVTGSGSLVIPVFQKAQYVGLGAETAILEVDGVDSQKIPIGIRGSVVFKVGDDATSITNAATRFLGSQDTRGDVDYSKMHGQVKEVVHGHLRSIIGGLSVEDLIANRNELATQARDATYEEIQRLGLVIDSLQIQDIVDPSGYIRSLGEPRTAEVKMNARIANAAREREAAQREQEAKTLTAEAERDTELKLAGYRAEQEAAAARADQAGPLAAAEAQKAVVEKETEVAQLQAQLRERELITEVNKPADAAAYAQRVSAEAQRDAQVLSAQAEAQDQQLTGEAAANVIRLKGEAEAEALKSKGLAEAAAIEARAKALEKESEAVIQTLLAEKLPEIVAAAASAFDNVDNMVVLNGAEGVTKVLGEIIGQGSSLLNFAKGTGLTGEDQPTGTNGVTKVTSPSSL